MTSFGNISERHFWKKNPNYFYDYIVLIFCKNFGNTLKRQFWKKNPTTREISAKNVERLTRERIREHLRNVLNVAPSVAKITHSLFVKTALSSKFF